MSDSVSMMICGHSVDLDCSGWHCCVWRLVMTGHAVGLGVEVYVSDLRP